MYPRESDILKNRNGVGDLLDFKWFPVGCSTAALWEAPQVSQIIDSLCWCAVPVTELDRLQYMYTIAGTRTQLAVLCLFRQSWAVPPMQLIRTPQLHYVTSFLASRSSCCNFNSDFWPRTLLLFLCSARFVSDRITMIDPDTVQHSTSYGTYYWCRQEVVPSQCSVCSLPCLCLCLHSLSNLSAYGTLV
jgi:hypothetical protein